MMSGIFISFEGGEGSGKTTQIKLLSNWIMGQWAGRVTQTREPGGTNGAELIRNLLVTGDEKRWDSVTEALLMTASRRDNLMRIIKPALEDGDAVITDRFYDSTSVYQGIVGGASAELINALNSLCLDEMTPDVTILLDIDPQLGLSRSTRAENVETRFENKGLEFHQKVRAGYLELAKAHPERFMVVDASRNEKVIHDDIIARLTPVLKARS
ncbi:MAG: dTMP kinase [Alphaproteobacteria bacterium]|nr:dTMP kinase [Alphaproteobacteria bacterium]